MTFKTQMQKEITKRFCLRCWLEFWHKSQMPDWTGFILSQILHCMEQNPGCKENHFYSLPFGQAEASTY